MTMKPSLRSIAWLLLLILILTLGCSAAQCYGHTDEPEISVDEKAALWEKMLADRPTDFSVRDPALKVVVIDVGQGDSILLVSPEGKTMLVDAGPAGSFDRIAGVLTDCGVASLDAVVATHPHEDHIGSMANVLDAYDAGAFYTIAAGQDAGSYAGVIAAAQRNGCPLLYPEGGAVIPWAESCTVTVLNPISTYEAEPQDMNDRSVVLHVRYKDTAVLLTGDAGEVAEKRMLDTFPRYMLQANVLKLGHHGSSTSTGYSFFLAVDPDFAVASCEKDNEFGHPHPETMSLLYDTHTAFYRTDLDGTVTFLLDGENVSVHLP